MVILVVVVLIIVTALTILATPSSWGLLARHYGGYDIPPRLSLWCRSATIGDAGYGGLVLTGGPEGLGIRPFPIPLPSWVNGANLLLPWPELRARRQRGFVETLELRTKAVPELSIWIRASLVERLAAAGGIEVRELEDRW